MKVIKFIILSVVALLVLITVFAYTFLSGSAYLERSITINAPVSKLYTIVNDLGQSNEWSPWFSIDPETKYVFEGAPTGVGSKMTWLSKHSEVGVGSQEIIESVENSKIKTELYFAGFDAPGYATFTFQPKDDGVLVTWSFEEDFGMDLFARFFILFLEDVLGPQYEQGLQNLADYQATLPDVVVETPLVETDSTAIEQ